jgi:deoxyribonuclease V
MFDFAMKEPESATEALSIQQEMRSHVRIEDDFPPVRTVAGIDVGYDIRENVSKAALVLMTVDDLAPVTSIVDFDQTPFPYIPGLLSFREAPVILKALSQLKEMPDMLFIDGHGIAHPRRLGIAAHIGVLTGLPAVGIAKSVLCGHYKEPGPEKGSREPLIHKGERIGTALRSREKVKPVFISPGHRIGHESAVALVERCLTRYRLPEPTRLADKLSKFPARNEQGSFIT